MALLVHPDSLANSFCSVAEADSLHDMRGSLSDGWAGIDLARRESLLISATHVLSIVVVPAGERETGLLHRLPFPRSGIVDRITGVNVPVGEIPPDLRLATAVLALEMNSSNPFAPAGTAGFGRIKIEGAIELVAAPQTISPTIPDEVQSILVPEIAVRINLPGQSPRSVFIERF